MSTHDAEPRPAGTAARYLTRAGRDPLTLIPMGDRVIDGRTVSAPGAWSDGSVRRLLQEGGSRTPADLLRDRASELAAAAYRARLVASEEDRDTVADELTALFAKGMGWVARDEASVIGALNLTAFYSPATDSFELASMRSVVRTLMLAAAGTALESGVRGQVAWTNLAGLFMSSRLAYDGSRAHGVAGALAGIILAEAMVQQSRMASVRSDLADLSAKAAGLDRLRRAEESLKNLPPQARAAESSRWRQEASAMMIEAIRAVDTFGCLDPEPVAGRMPEEADAILDPISRQAEAIPTLDGDRVDRAEVRNALRARGISDEDRDLLTEALRAGLDPASKGVDAETAAAFRTALGPAPFHPNAQVSLAATVAPFVESPLAHRIHVPAGVPDAFLNGLKSLAVQSGLPQTEFAVAGAAADQAEADRLEGSDGSASPEPPAETSTGAGEAASLAAVSATVTAAALAAQGVAETPAVEVEAPEAEQPEPPEPEIPATAVEESEPVEPEAQATEPEPPEPEIPATAVEASDLAEPEAQSTEPEIPEPETPETAVEASDLAEPEAQATEPEPTEPETPATAVETSDLAEPEAQATEPEQTEPTAPWGAVRLPESRVEAASPGSETLRVRSAAGRVLVHILRDERGRVDEVAATAYDADPQTRAMLDALMQAISIGLRHGESPAAYLEEIREPALVRDALLALAARL
ncbi:MAG: hypothetical protein MH204_08760 [Fimbriimonadaceae bacterium]|nr:hypothetical protein [Fimbriimonadaceae bacterium]